MSKKHLPYLIAVALITGAVYANCLRNDFNLDDTAIIRDNSLIRNLGNLPKIFVSNYWANTPYASGVLLYRPLVVATFAVDYAVAGNNPAWFHLVNLMLNAANAGLVFVLLAMLSGGQGGAAQSTGFSGGLLSSTSVRTTANKPALSSREGEGDTRQVSPLLVAVATLLFALHPVHTEAVDMVVGRTELLAALFGLLTFIFHLRGQWVAAPVCFLLALLCKEIAVTIPVMIFIYEWLVRRPFRWRERVSYAGGLVIYLIARFSVLHGFVSTQQTGILYQQDFFHRLLTVIKVMGYYLRLLVAPYSLSPDYSDVPWPVSILDLSVIVPGVVMVGLLLVGWKLRVKAAGVTFAIAWFLVTLLPVSNIISIGAFLGERFLYLPSVSVALMVTALAVQITREAWHRLFLGTALLGSLGFGVMTFQRNFDWRDAKTLWTVVYAQQPENPRANYQLAVAAEAAQDPVQAREFYERAIKYYPHHNWNPDSKSVAEVKGAIARLCYNEAVNRYRSGLYDESATYCRQALTNHPNYTEAYVVLGNISVHSNDLGSATGYYEAALKLDPDQYEARENLKRIRELSR